VALTFIDTNVFVYVFDHAEPSKQSQCEDLVAELLDLNEAVISYQVIQEFAATALRRFRKTMTAEDLETYIERVLWPICSIFPSPLLYSQAIAISQETGWTFDDSLIVSGAVNAGCSALVTEDLQGGRKIRGVEIRNPFE
jgi:predicted nucleic acid-binding protein